MSPRDVRLHSIGSVLNGGGAHPNGNKNSLIQDWIDLAENYYQSGVTLPDGSFIPPVWGSDAVNGHNNVRGATLFPHNIGLGAANDPDLVEAIAVATAREVKATGIDWISAPTVAVAPTRRRVRDRRARAQYTPHPAHQ